MDFSKVKVGDRLKLTGKTQKGKNRVRENGEIWIVKGGWRIMPPMTFAPGAAVITVIPARDDRKDEWRHLLVPTDPNFEIAGVS